MTETHKHVTGLHINRQASAEAIIEPFQLGERLRTIRRHLNLTLDDVSKKTGLAPSTLSKIENGHLSPTFTAVQKLLNGLDIDIPQLFTKPKTKQASGRRVVTRAGEGIAHPTPTYEHELLATDMANKRMLPFKTRVRAHSFNDFNDWVRHEGEEFLLVLEGEISLYTEFYEPVKLKVGDSIYYDASMGHALISLSHEDALILWITAR